MLKQLCILVLTTLMVMTVQAKAERASQGVHDSIEMAMMQGTHAVACDEASQFNGAVNAMARAQTQPHPSLTKLPCVKVNETAVPCPSVPCSYLPAAAGFELLQIAAAQAPDMVQAFGHVPPATAPPFRPPIV